MADGSVTIEVTLTKNQLESGLKSLKSTIDSAIPSASSTLTSLSNAFTSLGKTATKAGTLITAATAVIVKGLSSAVSRFDTLQNFPKVLENLGFSAEEAEKSIQDLSDGIDGLPTALDDAATSVQRLVAKNSDIDKSTKYFLAMNDAIIAGGASADTQATALEQLTQAYSKGKPDLMEWRTLMTAMPGQLKQVATAMGYVDTDELYEALQQGIISMDDFMDELVILDTEGAEGIVDFQTQAQDACAGIGTAMTNLGNRLKKGCATILENLNNMAADTSFGSLAGMINSLSTSIKNLLDKIGGAITENAAAQSLISGIASALGSLSDYVNNISSEQLDSIVTAIVRFVEAGPTLLVAGKAFTTLGTAFKGLSSVSSVFEKFSSGISSFVGSSSIFKNAVTGIENKLIDLPGEFGTAFTGIFSVLDGNGGKILSGFTKSFNIAAIVGLVVAGLGLVQSQFGDKISEIANVAIEQGPTIITNLINGIVSKIPDLISQGSTLIQTLLDVVIANLPSIIDGGVQIITSLVTGIANEIPSLIPKMLEVILTIVNSLIANQPLILEAGIQLLMGLINGIIACIPTLVAMLHTIISTIVSTLLTMLPQIIEAGVQLLIALINGIINAIPQLIAMLPEIILTIVETLLSQLPQIIDAGINILIALIDGLINAIPQLIAMIPQIISSIVNTITTHLPEILQMGITCIVKLAAGLIQAIPQLVAKIPQIVTAIIEGIGDAVKKIPEVGVNLIKGLWQGISDTVQWLYDKISGFVSGCLDKIKSFFGINSPSKLMRDEIGKFLPSGIAVGVDANADTAIESMENMCDDLIDSVDVSAAYDKLSSAVDVGTINLSEKMTADSDTSGTTKTISNSNTTEINNTQNFYDKSSTPYEEQKQAKLQLRRLAYEL